MEFVFERTREPVKRTEKGKSLLKAVTNYVVVDLETTGLDPRWDEIIEIAAVKVEDNQITNTFNTLIKPDEPIDPFITSLTGITNAMVKDSPKIAEALPSFLDFVGDSIIIGHNVNFDINFLYDNCERSLDCALSNDFIDTMRLSRRLHPEEKHHRLKDLVKRYSLVNEKEHRALSDVLVTKQCYDYLCQYVYEQNIDLVALSKPSRKPRTNVTKLSAKDIVPTVEEFDESSPIFDNVFVFTGALERMTRREAMQEVANRGGICGDNITQKTNYLVLGNNDYCKTIKDGKSTKQKKAEQLKLNGNEIEIISEDVFYDMLEL